MSEFSDSCHLRATEQKAAIDLLRAARVPGYVFAPAAGWVPFVFPLSTVAGDDDLVRRVGAANTGILVHYTYARNHGCSATLYRGPHVVSQLDVSFESTQAGRFDRAPFVELGLLSAADAEDIARWVADPKRDEELLIVASRLHLPRHELFSFDYEDRRAATPDRLEVAAFSTATARALVDELVRTHRVVLVSSDEAEHLAADLAADVREESGDIAEIIIESLGYHESVEEHSADLASVRAILERPET